ncbi:hypothetical protein [Halopseudomonas salina]|uniref:hypothetical protein n=1 Tax=Halopseudomonas salina TaxID=1323744 RepID=UPI00123C658D|nr:hypothetical protein [Halopseudomonas salina]
MRNIEGSAWLVGLGESARIKLVWSSFFLAAIIALVLAAIYLLKTKSKLPLDLNFSPVATMLVMALMLSVYFLSAFLWQRYLRIYNIFRSFQDILIDTGFLVIGKYFPGKIVGILGRGIVSKQGVKLSRINSIVSVGEQISSLCIGVLTAGWVIALVYISGLVSLSVVTVCYFFLLCISIRFSTSVTSMVLGKGLSVTTVSIYSSFTLGIGYASTWLFTGISIIPLFGEGWLAGSTGLLLAAFLISVIAGWLAFLAPAGIGVREAIFTSLAGSIVPWEHALSWVLMHRLICCVIDVMFGVTCVVLTTFRYGKK